MTTTTSEIARATTGSKLAVFGVIEDLELLRDCGCGRCITAEKWASIPDS